MKLPDKTNAVLTAIGLLAGALGTGGAIDAKMDAGENREMLAQQQVDLKEWVKSQSIRISELEKLVAEGRGYDKGFDAGVRAGGGP